MGINDKGAELHPGSHDLVLVYHLQGELRLTEYEVLHFYPSSCTKTTRQQAFLYHS
jgi:hypothetical protein